MNINFEYYKVFCSIAKTKNITRAANELHISQPAISRLLKSMEEQIGHKLFIRDNKGVILTKEGSELYNLISSEINNIINAENIFSRIISSNQIKIAINQTLLNYFINTKKFDKILTSNKNISFLSTSDYNVLNRQLKNGLIDVAIIVEPTNYKFDDSLIYETTNTLHLCIISNSKSINAFDKPLTYLDSNHTYKEIIQSIHKKLNNNSGLVIIDNYENILPLVKNGYANGLVLKELLEDDLINEKIYEIPIDYQLPNINIGVLYNINNQEFIKNQFNIS